MDRNLMKRASMYSAAFLTTAVSPFAASSTFAQDTPPPQSQAPPKPAGRDYEPLGDDRSSTQLAPTVSDLNTTDFILGNVSLLEQWSHSQLTLNYSGGRTFSTDPSLGNYLPTFNSWFTGAGVDRPIGRTTIASVGYTAYPQDRSDSVCTALTGNSYVQHQISVSFRWRTRPFVLR
jgi:hypothetical protein